MDKHYIELNYKVALGDYELARTVEERFKALRELKSLEELAALKYGFDYADELHRIEGEKGQR